MDTWIEKRKHPRIDVCEEVSFTVSLTEEKAIRNVTAGATMVNRSAGGACIRTEILLEPGHVLMLTHENRTRLAIVQWSYMQGSCCVAGLMHV